MAIITLTEVASTPTPPASGQADIYIKTDNIVYTLSSGGIETALGSSNSITGLTGDVSATGPGTVPAIVNSVGGQTAANIASATVAANAAISANTPSTIVKRDASGNFSAGTITAALNGNASTATTAGSSTNFTGSLSGDVTGTQGATVVSYVDSYTAAQVGASVLATQDATSTNTASTIVERDASGNFAANVITASLTGNVTGNVSGSSSSFTGSLSGDVTGTQSATTVDKIQGTLVNSTTPTDAQLLLYNSTSTQWVPESLSGDINVTHSGLTTIQPNSVSNSKLAQMAANTVKANKTGSTANPTDTSLGTVTESISSVLVLSGWSDATLGSPTIQVEQAGASQSGYLSSTDWNTFHSTSGAAITALTGDATATGPGSVPITLATVNSNVGSFGTQTQVPTITVNAKGLVTAASNTTIGNLTNSNLSGSAGITGSNIATNTIANTNLAQMAPNTVKANTTGVAATPVDTALGTVTETTSSVLTLTGWTDATIGSPTIQVTQAGSSTSGYLSSSDWNNFENTYNHAITSLTGDITATGPGSAAATLATVNVSPGTFGSSTAIPTITVNGKGLSTTITTNPVIAPAGTLTGTTLAANVVNSTIENLGTQNANLNMGNNEIVNVSEIGIGTSTPQAGASLDIVNTSGSTQPLQQTGYGATTVLRGRYANGTLSVPTAAISGNTLHSFSGRGYGTTGFAGASTGVITVQANGTFTDTSMPTSIVFNTTPTSSITSVQRMEIAPTGNILIGTSTDNATDLVQVNGGIESTYHKLAGATSGYLDMTVPSTVTTYTLVWPSAVASTAGQFLSSDGSGNLSWTNPVVNIDGGNPSSIYTSGQYVSGGTP